MELLKQNLELVKMQLQHGSKYQHVKIDQQMEMLKQCQIICVLKLRNKLFVGAIDQHGQEDLLVYCFDDNHELLKFNEFAKQQYKAYKEANAC